MKKLVLSRNFLQIQASNTAVPTIHTVHHHRRYATSAATTTRRRIPPKSLLEKQKRRLERQKQSLEVKVPQSQLQNEQPPFNSFDDIAKLFKTNAFSEEDEDTWQQGYKETIRRRYESGGFIDLLQEKFQLASPNGRLNTSVLLREFPRLSQEDIDLIKYSLENSGKRDIKWDKLPTCQQQLLYYLSYGPIGPRAGFQFDKLEKDEVKSSSLLVSRIDPLTRGVLALFVIICAMGVTSEIRSNLEGGERTER